MKKSRIYVYSALSLFSLSLLAGCNGSSTVDIKFVNYDGELLLELKEVEKGTEVAYTGNNPVRFDDESNYYVYKGWDKEITEAKKDTTYTAQYDAYPLTSVEETPDGYIDVLPDEVEQGNILQAFCWKYSDVQAQLPFIKNAGYKAVQLSPVQVPKSSGSAWWAFYQPLSFTIADGEQSPLGTKAELKTLCDYAEASGIRIIVDVVFNHMANIGDDELEEDGTPKVSPDVETYEPEIYAARNATENPTFHHNKQAKGSGAETQYYPFGQLPDLNTANELVQNRALAFLKECIDVGVDGFRFDAAKHIETPNDPDYASEFWVQVLGTAERYYKNKTNRELYAYGEVLGNPKDRDIDVYTKLMHVTETAICNSIETSAFNHDAAKAVNAHKGFDIDPKLAVSWMESHDTYIDSKNPLRNEFLARCWAILTSKKESTNLYLARPDNHDSPSVGLIGDYFYREEVIAASNRFHNRYIGGDSFETANGSIYINERVKGNDTGAIVVDLGLNGKTTVDFTKLGTGVYYDQLTGNSVVVRNGHATIDTGSTGILVLTKSKNVARPSFEIDYRGGVIANDRDIKVTAKNAETVKYSVNGGSDITLPDNKIIQVTKSMFDSQNKLTIKVTASNSQFSVSEEYHYTYVDLIPNYFNVVNVKASRFEDYNIYMWSWKGDEGTWSQNFTVQNGIILIDTASMDVDGLLLALFNKDHTITNIHAWDNAVVRQTTDINSTVIAQGYYDGTNF